MLLLASFAVNKVQGFALMKATGILWLPPLLAWFVGLPWQLLFGIFPTYWPVKLFWMLTGNDAGSGLLAIIGLTIANLNIPNPQDALFVTLGSLVCCFIPGVIVDIVAGWGLLQHKSWARILAIILGIINLVFFPIGTALGIYTLWVMFNDEAKALFEAGG